ncbi:MAG TPA: DJ-1/PfpI family protein [Chitinophagaceae bacterium]|jgi:transcriptional regulator GlxA family with amidase domain|nr:DJ-1/PfpI family protein [Chitinophagaceae bacterium]
MAKKVQIAFFVPKLVHLLDLTGSVQVFYEAKCYGAEYELLYFSLDDQIISSAGLPFYPVADYHSIELSAGDFIFLPGAEMDYLRSKVFKNNREFFNWLIQRYKAGVKICSVCTGAFVLAETGLLDAKTCTTHWKRIKELQDTFPKILTKDNILFTHENNLYTSAGITSGIDLSLAIVEEQYGPLFANKVSRELLVYYRRGANHNQESVYLNYRNHIQTSIHLVQDWLIEHLELKFTITQLADISNMSERNLTRVFKKTTGITINEYVRQLRLEKIKTIERNTELKSEVIAQQIGYKSVRQLRRIKKSISE